jgi:uncharacterized protein (DUF1697 family)
LARYVAFLRAINVGGHTVRMDQLRKHFEDLGLDKVSTFIASGNVIFESDETNTARLEQRIEHALDKALGYAVGTLLRSDVEIAAIAEHVPFKRVERRAGDRLYIVLLRDAPIAAAKRAVHALATERDLLEVHGRELYWLSRGPLMESTINDTALGRVLGKMTTTTRNANTLRRLAAKLPVSDT